MTESNGEGSFSKRKYKFFSKIFSLFVKREHSMERSYDEDMSQKNLVNDFLKMKASDIMLDRSSIAFVSSDDPTSDLYDLFLLDNFANDKNIVVCENSDLDKPLGYLSCKDFGRTLSATIKAKDFDRINSTVSYEFSSFIKNIVFVAPSMLLSKLVEQFRSNDLPFVIVVDEYRGTDGIITFESLTQSIFEYIIEEPNTASADRIEALGNLSLRSLEKKLKLKIKDGDANIPSDIKTVGGLASFLFGRIPASGEKISNKNIGLLMEIKDADAKQIKKLLISKIFSD